MRDRDLIWQPGVVGGDPSGRRWLEFRAAGDCERCARGEGCGAATFARLFTRAVSRLPVPADVSIAPGRAVVVGVQARWLLLAAAVLYLAPVGGFVAGAATAELLWPGRDALALATGLAIGAGGFIAARRFGRRVPPRLRIEAARPGRLESGADGKQVECRPG